MPARILPLTLIVLLLGVGTGLAQATAEATLMHGNSATATARSGTVLGRALNKASRGIAGQVQNVPRPSVVTHRGRPAPQAPGSLPATAAGSSMIVSIQGGRLTRPAAASPQQNLSPR